jgi:YebC/PmpR family DNA-binding regulatory protein
MGRIFETRKSTMFARWAKMSKAFTKVGKEIAMSVKQGGPDPATNAKLRAVIQNAKAMNMPKDRIESAIKRALGKEEKDLEEVVYEGYAPHGVALIIETATDNPTRTVANLRLYLNKAGGSLSTQGSVGFMFERKALFRIADTGQDLEELEFSLIDSGAEEVTRTPEGIVIKADFKDYGSMQKALEAMNANIQESLLKRFATTAAAELTDDQEKEVSDLLEKLEDDDDVQNVFHNIQ